MGILEAAETRRDLSATNARKAELEVGCNYAGPEAIGRQASRSRVNGSEKVAPCSADLHARDGQSTKGYLNPIGIESVYPASFR